MDITTKKRKRDEKESSVSASSFVDDLKKAPSAPAREKREVKTSSSSFSAAAGVSEFSKKPKTRETSTEHQEESQEFHQRERAPRERPVLDIDMSGYVDTLETLNELVEEFIPEELWKRRCSIGYCEGLAAPYGSEVCFNCGNNLDSHYFVLKPDQEGRGGVILLLNRFFQYTRAIRAAIYLFQYLNAAEAMLAKFEAELGELSKHLIGRQVSPNLRGVVKGLDDTFAKYHQQKIMTQITENKDAAVLHGERRVRLLCIADALYYALYHFCLTSKLGIEKKYVIPTPLEYFKQFSNRLESHRQGLKKFVDEDLDDEARTFIDDVWEGLEVGEKDPVLLGIFKLKWIETVELFSVSPVRQNGRFDRVMKKTMELYSKIQKRHPDMKKVYANPGSGDEELEEPICYKNLQAWRDMCRDWPCLIYAYVTPTRKALKTIAKYSPIVEMGAGTGYWASLLVEMGADVECYDIIPPSITGTQHNEFHAGVPSFVEVHERDVIHLAAEEDAAQKALFLCSPPPQDNMAISALQYYAGNTVIYVGEWEGFTATQDFEVKLQKDYVLVEKMQLPNWSDSAYFLSIWKLKSSVPKKEAKSNISVIECSKCHAKATPDTKLYKCRFCRVRLYCGPACCSSDQDAHKAQHALRSVHLTNNLGLFNPLHFKPLKPLTN